MIENGQSTEDFYKEYKSKCSEMSQPEVLRWLSDTVGAKDEPWYISLVKMKEMNKIMARKMLEDW